jgi:hypothetical protein
MDFRYATRHSEEGTPGKRSLKRKPKKTSNRKAKKKGSVSKKDKALELENKRLEKEIAEMKKTTRKKAATKSAAPKKKAKAKKKPRTAAQKAATKKMLEARAAKAGSAPAKAKRRKKRKASTTAAPAAAVHTKRTVKKRAATAAPKKEKAKHRGGKKKGNLMLVNRKTGSVSYHHKAKKGAKMLAGAKDDLKNLIMLAVGAVAGHFVIKKISQINAVKNSSSDFVRKHSPDLLNAGAIAVGVGAPVLVKKIDSNPMIKNVFTGLALASLANIAVHHLDKATGGTGLYGLMNNATHNRNLLTNHNLGGVVRPIAGVVRPVAGVVRPIAGVVRPVAGIQANANLAALQAKRAVHGITHAAAVNAAATNGSSVFTGTGL